MKTQRAQRRDLLIDGLDVLCDSDADVKTIIEPRRDEIIFLLEKYIKEIETFNEAYGLVKVSNRDELIIKHILDSLAPLGIISRLLTTNYPLSTTHYPLQIGDAGSGAGLPGIPLAIALPNCKFTLIERMGRRAGFLFSTTAALGLSNVSVEEKELERIESDLFDLVTFRAFAPLEPKILKTLFRVCKKTGIIAAYKGQRKKIEQEITLVEKYCGKRKIIPYSVPLLDEQRHLAVLSEATI